MSALILPRRFTQQPQGAVEADLSSPFLIGNPGVYVFNAQGGLIVRDSTKVTERSGAIRGYGISSPSNNDNAYVSPITQPRRTTEAVTLLFYGQMGTAATEEHICSWQPNGTLAVATLGPYNFGCTGTPKKVRLEIRHSTAYVNALGATIVPSNTPSFIAGTYDRQNIKVFLNGRRDGITAQTNAMQAGTQAFECLRHNRANNATSYWSGIAGFLVVLPDVALPESAIFELSKNPWQIFKPRRNVLYFGGSGSGITITVADASHGHAADGLTLTTATALSAADALHGHAADQAALSTNWLLAVADAASAHVADGPALTVASVLAVADALHAHISDSLGLSTRWLLTVADALHGHAADNALLDTSLATTLTAQDALHGHTADVLALVTNWLLAVADAAHGHAADNVTLSATGSVDLALADAVHAHLADNAGLSTATTLAILEAIHAHTAEALTLFFSSFTQAQLDEILAYVEANMAVPTANEIAIAVWQMVLEGALTAEQMQRIMLAALAGKRSGLGTAAEKYMGLDGVTPRVTFTPSDASGNGTTVVDGA